MSTNYHLKLVCLVSVSSVLFLSAYGPWCPKTLSLSWFALFLSLLCSFCLLVGLGAQTLSSQVELLCFCLFCALSVFSWALVPKNSHLKLICFVSVSSVLFLSSCGPWCQKTLILSWFALFLSLLCSFCLLVGLGVKKLSSEVDLLCVCLFCALSVFLWALVS